MNPNTMTMDPKIYAFYRTLVDRYFLTHGMTDDDRLIHSQDVDREAVEERTPADFGLRFGRWV